MTDEQDNDVDQAQNALQEHGKASGRLFHPALPVTIVLGVMFAAVLLPGILSEDGELPETAPVSEEAAVNTPPVVPEQTQELSPQALEDLRSDPALDLLINPEPLLLDLLPEEIGEVTEDAPAPETPEEGTQGPAEEPFSVGEALARYLLAIRNELNSEYVANCIRFRNSNGVGAGCPENPAFNAGNYQQEQALVDELFAIITREGEYARISSRLEKENETLAAILDDPENPAALQASTKLALNNAYLAYLNGNPSPAVAAFNTMNDFVNDYNRTILVGPTQFRCQDGPCVYEYTGPEAE